MDGVSLHEGDEESVEYRLHRRFDRMGRLVGDPGMARLRDSLVVVMGLGGVGSFAAGHGGAGASSSSTSTTCA